MPPTGGIRTSLAWQARYPLGQAVSDAVFSPGQPLSPIEQEPVRVWDFPVGVNAFITPRTSEPFGFAHLRAFSNVELLHLVRHHPYARARGPFEAMLKHPRMRFAGPEAAYVALAYLTAGHPNPRRFLAKPEVRAKFPADLDVAAFPAPDFD